MKVLSRYIAWEYTKVLVVAFSAIAAIYILAHFLGKLDEFIQFQASPSLIGILILLKVPQIFYDTLPIVVLLATLITLSLLSRNHEITALRSCGTGLMKLIFPFLAVTSALVLFSLADAEWGVPYANARLEYLDDVALKKKAPILALRKNRIWLHTGENTYCNILKVIPHRQLLNQVTLYVFDPDFHLRSRMDAPQVTWNGSEWVTRKGTEWTFDHSGSIVEERKFKGPFPFTIPLEEIIDVEKRPIDMGYGELRDYIGILKRKGYASITYEVDLYTKISYSVIALVMVLIAIPFSLKTNRRGGVALSIGLGLGIGFFFWMAFSVGVSLGHAGHLHPMLGAWLVNFLVGAGALYGVFRIRY